MSLRCMSACARCPSERCAAFAVPSPLPGSLNRPAAAQLAHRQARNRTLNDTPSADRPNPAAMHVRQFTAAKLLTLSAFGLLLYVAHQAFIPIALALLAALILSGPVEMLFKFRIPRSLSATVILILFLAATAGLV